MPFTLRSCPRLQLSDALWNYFCQIWLLLQESLILNDDVSSTDLLGRFPAIDLVALLQGPVLSWCCELSLHDRISIKGIVVLRASLAFKSISYFNLIWLSIELLN